MGARGVSLDRRFGGGTRGAANCASQQAGVVRLDPRFRGGDDTGRDGSSRAPTRALRHSRASGNTRPAPASPSFPRKRESRTRRPLRPFPRAARPNAAARGRERARPVGARGVSLDPRFRGGDDTGHDGSSRAPTRHLRHSRASGNPGEVGSARPPGPRYVAPSRTSDRILANPRRRKQEGVHRTLTPNLRSLVVLPPNLRTLEPHFPTQEGTPAQRST